MSEFFKPTNVVKATQFNRSRNTHEYFHTTLGTEEVPLFDVAVAEEESYIISDLSWIVKEDMGNTSITYILSNSDFNKIMQPVEAF